MSRNVDPRGDALWAIVGTCLGVLAILGALALWIGVGVRGF
jgi:hypothetical protein